jgi:hypothetical protein
MHLLTITCAACGRAWAGARGDCVYERLAIESCPCPACGAYTLGLHEPPAPRRRVSFAQGGAVRRRRPEPPAAPDPGVEIRRAAG